MLDYHLKYNELINKTNALFAEDSNILERIFNMINYSPMQVIEQKEERGNRSGNRKEIFRDLSVLP